MEWDGKLPCRRYAIFNSLIHGNYMIIIKDWDIKSAPKWGGFVSWIGKKHFAEIKKLPKPKELI